MGSLAFIPAEETPLALDIQSLANKLVRLNISEPSRVLTCVVAQSSLLGQIKAQQFDDPHLVVLREMVLQGGAKEVSIGKDGVLRLQGPLCVPNVDGLRERILEEAHIHKAGLPTSADAYTRVEVERINMDFVIGLPRTLQKFDSVWVIVDKLTKSSHFIPVATTYTIERYAQIYIREIVQLHSVPISIISDRGPQFTSHFWRAVQTIESINESQAQYDVIPHLQGGDEETVPDLNYPRVSGNEVGSDARAMSHDTPFMTPPFQ
ncbi:uncharacterized protein [Nicotiana sylvestris]|uniref:uncharacterized protein n=1 Tax=Nicotiana sylvestris TaxID=4096 RepID=UPI00388CDE9A